MLIWPLANLSVQLMLCIVPLHTIHAQELKAAFASVVTQHQHTAHGPDNSQFNAQWFMPLKLLLWEFTLTHTQTIVSSARASSHLKTTLNSKSLTILMFKSSNNSTLTLPHKWTHTCATTNGWLMRVSHKFINTEVLTAEESKSLVLLLMVCPSIPVPQSTNMTLSCPRVTVSSKDPRVSLSMLA